MKKHFTILIFFLITFTIIAQQQYDAKINELIGKMTLKEKIGQMTQGVPWAKNLEEGIREGHFGSLLNAGDIDTKMKYQKLAVEESRLGIPLLFGRDVIHGYRTVMPLPLALGATWNPELVENTCRVAAYEASQQGIHWTFAPMMDITRDPRWGRIVESPSEDPYLASQMAVAMVKGFQGDKLSDKYSMAACAKHYVGYGASEAGRDYNTTLIPETELRNVYLAPFKAAVKAGVATIMSGFNDLNGVPASGNIHTIRNILKNEWGFDGFVVSDWKSIDQMVEHGFAKDDKQAAEKAVKAGVDMEMAGTSYLENLERLVEEGKISVSEIDDAVRRILKIKFELGLFDNPFRELEGEKAILTDENKEVAREAARESFVLLKNEGILPLKENYKRIAVIGPMADSGEDQIGTWTPDGKGEEAITPLTSLKNFYGNKIKYVKALDNSRDTNKDFDEAIETASNSDIVLLFLGEDAILSGEAHCRTYLNLPGSQSELIRQIEKTGKPIVLIIMAGRPLTFSEEAGLADAVIYAWHPGTMGGPAIVDILSGKFSPSGRLPVTFPRTVGQIPIYYNHRNTGRPAPKDVQASIPLGTPANPIDYFSYYLDAPNTPAYPFGFGLSYTEFEYDDLKLSADTMEVDGSITISVKVKNVGDYDAQEVVQLYVRDLYGSITRPVKELKGFKKIFLKSGEEKIVTFTLKASDLAFYNSENKWVIEPGEFKLWVGPNSSEGLETEFEIK